jgi:hypothetical protein
VRHIELATRRRGIIPEQARCADALRRLAAATERQREARLDTSGCDAD